VNARVKPSAAAEGVTAAQEADRDQSALPSGHGSHTRRALFDAGIDIGSQFVEETVIQQSIHPKNAASDPIHRIDDGFQAIQSSR
jgi:hypothetical protein